ncbi:MAG TPA: roadblock/LC7 domain-containing protein [Caldisericia bacterium]|nr:roadblock/LC7 domain-containing protein [Caldisericia bacterium]HPF49129.1 roadblock/LC7 domain-containing protein [Caldisericia bacterium]HPI83007.1 roadblock/LC7 domain-containing protein [Caldisericia bacterium]HPQ92234.1 roadblock/LC7 domain-containing protein [Caldisericia bacterium]HRV74668.1 roadblock/LC7 domain-containing protein [Caldisericia bacterium]
MNQPRISEIRRIIDQLARSNPDIIGCALVSDDGLPIYSVIPEHILEDSVSAMSATLYALGERVITDLISGELRQVYIKGDKGYVVISSVGDIGTLAVLAKSDAKLGYVLMVLRQVITELINSVK